MMNPISKTIYLNAEGQLIVKEINETYKPDASQALVKVAYSGINVCDLKFFYFGMHSYVTGFEFSGTMSKGPDLNFDNCSPETTREN